MTTTTPPVVHSARSPKTERWLDQLGATWTFNPDLPLANIDQAASLANQVRHIALDDQVVDRYAADFRAGDTFPAVLVDERSMALLGGNHRTASRRAAGYATIAAYLIDADATTLMRIRVEGNRNHGLPTTPAERIDHGLALIDSGIPQVDAARIVGLPAPKLSIAAGIRRLDQRLDGTVPGLDKLPAGSRYQLSMIDHDDVLDATARLTVAAALPTADVKGLVAAVNAAEPAEALRLIGQAEVDHEDRIRDMAGNARKAGKSARAKLDESLAVITGLDPVAIYDSCPNADVRAVLADRLIAAARVMVATRKILTGEVPR